ncbi:hypothetical protein BDY19DRAFT_1061190, partial [Irpex rosettiformis]
MNLFKFGLLAIIAVEMPYPLMKRWASLPQLVVGATVAWPIPIAWMSVTGGQYDTITIVMLCVAFGGSTFILDTIYACQDRLDDIQVGAKSATITLGTHLRSALLIVAAIVLASFAVAGIINGQRLFYFLVVVGSVAMSLGLPLCVIDFNNKEQ